MGAKNKSKLVVCGAAGRMSRRILALAIENGGFEVIGAVEKADHPDLGKDAGIWAGVRQMGLPITDQFPSKADIVIDFSLPEAADRTLEYCVRQNAALVLGTTGLGEKQHKTIRSASSKIPIVFATNMSVGMNTLFTLVGRLASMLGEDFDIEIVEQHHRFKKDAPSGSALTIAQNICKATGRAYPDSLVYGRQGKETLREKGQIGMHSVRAGDITGIHSIYFSTLGETITLEHSAHSRDTFARGAIRAAGWLMNKKPGLYSMTDVLGLK